MVLTDCYYYKGLIRKIKMEKRDGVGTNVLIVVNLLRHIMRVSKVVKLNVVKSVERNGIKNIVFFLH